MTSSQLNAVSSTAAAGSVSPSTAEENTLVLASSDIFNTAACIQEQLTKLGSTTNQIQKAQQSILSIQQQIDAAEADVAIARDRVSYIRHPEQHTSFYESWFPIDRPMHSGNVPIFVAITVFVIVFSLLVLLSLLGMNISISTSPVFMGVITYIMSQFTYLTLALVILVALVIYYFMSMKQS